MFIHQCAFKKNLYPIEYIDYAIDHNRLKKNGWLLKATHACTSL